ncbi:MAG: TaqI-like C-terminal specificity domain-containing protein [Candidatus Methylacidiphilales bacterium]|nr:TaqI-like C-terminal specificity domain-containing protein [Candidatus Methylacidiphilales bacterium]
MPSTDLRPQIEAALRDFASVPLADAARRFFGVLGYASERTLPLASVETFRAQLDPGNRLTDRDNEALATLSGFHLLFQLTETELTRQQEMHDDPRKVQDTRIESYLFFAAELPPGDYTRTALSTLVRAINKPLPMPALVLLRHGERISLGIIHRRLHKRDTSKDVLEKVTLIKDIAFNDPIRAHLEILQDFSIPHLAEDFCFHSFVSLHEAWQKRLGSYALSNKFYQEIADWYFWAHHQVEDGTIRLPLHCDTEQEKSLFLIRLLTRVIFTWFLVEKRLIPSDLFREHCLQDLLKDFHPSRDPKKPDSSPAYYHAILQNLFFGTLNMPPEQRGFREKKKEGERYDPNFGITNLWRYEDAFKKVSDWTALSTRVPFLNGGLFDCLDDKTGKKTDNTILDGFSDNPKLTCHLPNDLFFGPPRPVNLSKDYGEEDKKSARSKKATVRGLIEILSRYKFTIEENTPLEEEIALDPELLGKVFENLLASYNEDTRTTARKAFGAFYTPREIVSYMVDEALKSYLATQVPRCKGALDDLFSNKATLKEIKPDTRDALIAAIGRVKILDPACGSGAFPMGALHRLVDLLQKLDPNNESWKRDRLTEARRYQGLLQEAGAKAEEIAACDARIADIEKSFDTRYHALDFARKLYLIENCIYGVDIQPVATQIAKLRFFISLVVDQKVEPSASNLGVRPLPNLETRLVAADTLTPLPKPKERQGGLFDDARPEDYAEHNRLKVELTRVRHEHFNARDPRNKRRLRDEDAAIRRELHDLLKRVGLPGDAAKMMAAWDPYDQNRFAPFFDSEWMFGLPVGRVKFDGKALATLLGNITLINEAGGQGELTASAPREIDSGFDVVIGNPPYVLIQDGMRDDKLLRLYRDTYEVASYKIDLYHLFIERSVKLLKGGGSLAFITPSNFATNNYCSTLRQFLFRETQLREFLSFEENVFQASVNNWVFVLSRGAMESGKVAFYKGAISSGDLSLELISAIEQRSLREGHGLLVPPSDSNAGAVLEKIQGGRKVLGDFATVNFGMQLRDRKHFPGDVIDGEAQKKHMTRFHRPCVTGRDIRRFAVTHGGLYCYFNRTAKRGGCWDEAVHSAKDKVLVRQIGEYPEGGLDRHGHAVLNTAFMIYPLQQQEAQRTSRLLLAIINSPCVRFFWTNRFRDDRKTFPKIKGEYLKLIPIASATDREADVVIVLVDVLTLLNGHFAANPSAQTTRDPLMLAYWERVLNGLVYELYFPEELHAASLRLFDLVAQADLPDVTQIPEQDRLPKLRQKFEELHDGAHPIRIALDKLQTLDTVRIIEGKA